MKRIAFLAGTAAAVCLSSVASAQCTDWADGAEGYACGIALDGINGWEGWDNSAPTAAHVACAPDPVRTGLNSVVVNGFEDGIQVHQGMSSGKWIYTTYQYIPSTTTGTTFFIMLSTYMDYSGKVWEVQVEMNPGTGVVHNADFAGTPDIPLVMDAWVEIRVEIDLNAGLHDFYYDGNLFYAGGTWSQANIGATDLWSNGASHVYYDDFSIVPGANSSACCLTDGTCADYDFAADCEAAGGAYYPADTCDGFDCPAEPVFGSCCNNFSGDCIDGVQAECCVGPWDRFTADTACIDLVIACGDPLGWACCNDLGAGLECLGDETLENCESIGGSWYQDEQCFGDPNFLCPAPCELTVPPGGVDELEACGTSSNAGCAVGVAETLTLGVPVYGHIYSANFAGVRDSDWYVVDTTGLGHTRMTWTGQAQASSTLFGMLEYLPGMEGNGDCTFGVSLSGFIAPNAFADPCETVVVTTEPLPEGIYWWYLRPGNYASNQCGNANDYYAVLTAEPVAVAACCLEDASCITTDEAGCTAAGGTYFAEADCASEPCAVPCPADLAGPEGGPPDGIVNFNDLLVVLDAWGPNPGHPADLTDAEGGPPDGIVNFSDLLVILDAWGDC